jgi:hypothetical protein
MIVSCICLAAFPASAQIPAAVAPTSASDSWEVPLLAVDHEHRPVDGFSVEKLRIKLAGGAVVAPTSMRKELEEPLSLAILLDASRDSWHDLNQIGEDISSLAGISFLSKDNVTVYGLDCVMTRSMQSASPDAANLKAAVHDALSYANLHGGKSGSACGSTVKLWDNIAVAISGLSKAPGRRVLLLVSGGADHGSKYDWQTVQQYAFDQHVAVFALRDQRQADADTFRPGSLTASHSVGTTVIATITPPANVRDAQALELFCANAGGLTLSSNTQFRKDAIADILFLVRSRYILTIPRADWKLDAVHSAKATLPLGYPFFLSVTGASDPLTKP